MQNTTIGAIGLTFQAKREWRLELIVLNKHRRARGGALSVTDVGSTVAQSG